MFSSDSSGLGPREVHPPPPVPVPVPVPVAPVQVPWQRGALHPPKGQGHGASWNFLQRALQNSGHLHQPWLRQRWWGDMAGPRFIFLQVSDVLTQKPQRGAGRATGHKHARPAKRWREEKRELC